MPRLIISGIAGWRTLEKGPKTEGEFRRQATASGDGVVVFQRQFDPEMSSMTRNMSVGALGTLGPRRCPRLTPVSNVHKLDEPRCHLQACQPTSARIFSSRSASTHCYYCDPMDNRRFKCSVAPEIGGCGLPSHRSACCPGRPKANFSQSERKPRPIERP